MRVQFKTEGGIAYFPGLSKPVAFDVDKLPKEQARELKRRLDAADFANLPSTVGTPARGAADYRQYTITVENGRRRTVRVIEPIQNASVAALIEYLEELKSRAT